jgi:hypothetical protein
MYTMLGTIREWQDLVAGLLALIGAGITVYVMTKQARDAADRKRRASRALLPSTLADIFDYGRRSIAWLISLREKARIAGTGGYSKGSIACGTCPRPDGNMLAQLIECVEHLDKPHAIFISTILSKIQVHQSRMLEIAEYFDTYEPSKAKFRVAGDLENVIGNSVELLAYAGRLFRYARMETEAEPTIPDFADIENAFRQAAGLNEFENVEAWNKLTDRYPQVLPPHVIETTDLL